MNNDDWEDIDRNNRIGCVGLILFCLLAIIAILFIIKSAGDWIP